MHTIAAKAVAFGEALRPEFTEYAQQIVKNAAVLADELKRGGLKLVTGGTSNHLVLADVYGSFDIDGKTAQERLEASGITANANEPVVRESIRWKVEPSEPLLTVRPVPRSSLIEVTHTGKWSVTCDVIANGRRASLSPTAWTVTRTWVVDLTHRPLETRLSP